MTDHLIIVGAILASVGAMLAIHAITSRHRSQVRPHEAGTEPSEAQPRAERARGGDS